ncbi:MAG: dihydrolipoyl dehydrogenase family protein [Eisenbergiella massiliensis]
MGNLLPAGGNCRAVSEKGCDSFTGTGRILEKEKVLVTTGKEEILLTAPRILIAAGAKTAVPPIPGIDLPGVEDSAGLLARQEPYDSLIIIGGGVIGMEFASFYSDLGKKVTVLEAMDRILPGMDREISQNLKMILKKRGVDIHTKASVTRVERMEEGGFVCYYEEKGQALSASAKGLLAAVGRRADGESVWSGQLLGPSGTERGRIPVDENYRTRIPGIYAVGDVTGGIQLAHAATAEGLLALDHMEGREPSIDRRVIPSCVYTDPEIACAGLTCEEAKASGVPVKTAKYIMSLNGKSVLSGQERGFIRLVAREDNEKIVGAQLMCARATDMIGELALAISRGITAGELAGVIHPHPTFGEGIGEAARLLQQERT